MLLSKPAILRARDEGRIVISPFDERNLGSSQYDLTLGEHFWRRAAKPGFYDSHLYNPYDESAVRDHWTLCRATTWDSVVDSSGRPWCRLPERLAGVGSQEKVILVGPQETILAHTREFVGGRHNVTTMMKARSSSGRNGIEVCKCLPEDTEVRRGTGAPAQIKDLRVGDEVINVDCFGNSRVAVVSATRRGSPKLTRRIVTKGGRTLVCSVDHLLRVSRSDGLHTIEARELRVGDDLPVLMRWSPVRESGVSVDEAALLGYFVAEGNWQKYRLSFAKIESKQEARQNIIRLMRAVFPSAPDPKLSPYAVQYNSVSLASNFAERFPETARLGHAKRLPIGLFSASLPAVKAFLAAYMSCDGHFRKNSEAQTCSRSAELIRDIALLAARVGAVPSFLQRRTGTAGNIQSYGLYYGVSARRLCGITPDEGIDSGVFIPDLLDQIRRSRGLSREQLGGYAPSDRKRASRRTLDRIRCDDPRLSAYRADLTWDRVEVVDDSPIYQQSMIDISLAVESEEDSLFALGDGLLVLNCAGMGDVGFINRWTMEITNNSTDWWIPLVEGRRIAQLLFFQVEAISALDSYEVAGKYQGAATVEALEARWTPDEMIPKQWRDRETIAATSAR